MVICPVKGGYRRNALVDVEAVALVCDDLEQESLLFQFAEYPEVNGTIVQSRRHARTARRLARNERFDDLSLFFPDIDSRLLAEVVKHHL